MTFRRILIALGDGPIAAHAVDVGVDLARTLHADLALIHVLDPAAALGMDIGVSPTEWTNLVRQERPQNN